MYGEYFRDFNLHKTNLKRSQRHYPPSSKSCQEREGWASIGNDTVVLKSPSDPFLLPTLNANSITLKTPRLVHGDGVVVAARASGATVTPDGLESNPTRTFSTVSPSLSPSQPSNCLKKEKIKRGVVCLLALIKKDKTKNALTTCL